MTSQIFPRPQQIQGVIHNTTEESYGGKDGHICNNILARGRRSIDFQIQQSHFMYKITTKQQPSPKNVIAQRNDPDMFHQNSSWITEEK